MKNWSLNRKIWSVLALLIVAFIGSVYMGLSSMIKIRDGLAEITGPYTKRDQLTSTIQDGQRVLTIMSLEALLEQDPEKVRALKKRYEDASVELDKEIKAYEDLASEKGRGYLSKFVDALKKWEVETTKAKSLAEKKQHQEAFEVFSAAGSYRQEMRQQILEMNKLTGEQLSVKSAEANDIANNAIVLSLISAAVSILVSVLIAYFVLKALTRAIDQVVRNLFDASAQVSSASSQIASSSEELSQAATEQAASLEQTAASIEEMNSMVAKNSENASNTAQTSGQSQHKAAEGKEVVEKMIQSMDAINESNNTIMTQINHSNEQFSEIAKVIEEIGNKTRVINDIVFQTRLLSFNASVEAARAGEHGKGFAVVAEEVGNLAQMSGNAAKEISTMLEGSIQRVHSIVSETKESVAKLIADGKATVEAGASVARQCGEVLDDIVHNVGSVSNMANEIAQASHEQSRGVTEITKAMNQLDQMTQQNAATSEECASAAEELAAQSEALKNAVSHLVVTVNGANSQGDTGVHSSAPQTHSFKRDTKPKKQNVVPIKTSRDLSAEPSASVLKTASGDIPHYDSSGFKDI